MDATDDDKPSRLARGFFRVARDLHRALRAAKLNPLERSLFDQACEESWLRPTLDGTHEAIPFRLDLAELARVFEADRKRLGQAHRKLLRMGLLTEHEHDHNRINKDYRSWVNLDGTALLSPAQLDWIGTIRDIASGAPGAPRRPSRGASPPRRQRGAPSSLARRPLVVSEAPRPHIDEARAEFRVREEQEREEQHSTHARAGGEVVLPDTDLYPIHGGPHSPSEAEVRETHRVARAAFPGSTIPEEIFSHQRLVSPEVFRAAIREAHRATGGKVDSFRYILTIASKYETHGIPKAKLPASPPPGTRVDPGHGTPALPPRLAAIERQRIKIEEIKRARKEATDGPSV